MSCSVFFRRVLSIVVWILWKSSRAGMYISSPYAKHAILSIETLGTTIDRIFICDCMSADPDGSLHGLSSRAVFALFPSHWNNIHRISSIRIILRLYSSTRTHQSSNSFILSYMSTTPDSRTSNRASKTDLTCTKSKLIFNLNTSA